MSDSSTDSCTPTPGNDEPEPHTDDAPQASGLQFSSEKTQEEPKSDYDENRPTEQEPAKEPPRGRVEGGEYVTRGDGSVVCKLCGEVLHSRTHWYRHKYKLHAPPALGPAPLFQCDQCLVYFKSRKGYIGHLASRHSEVLSDTSPVLTNAQVEAMAKEQQQRQQLQQQQLQQIQQQQQLQQLQQQQLQQQHLQQQQLQQQQLQQHQLQQQQLQQLQQEIKEEMDPELAIPKSSVPNYQATTSKQILMKSQEQKKMQRNTRSTGETSGTSSAIRPQLDEKRIREEKLVTDIIDRVRKECEAQAGGGPARRGYGRRAAASHS